MNAIRLNRSAAPLNRTIVGYTALAVAVLGFIGAMPSVASAQTLEEAGAATPIALTQAMNDLSAACLRCESRPIFATGHPAA
jgi:hypothetical protein